MLGKSAVLEEVRRHMWRKVKRRMWKKFCRPSADGAATIGTLRRLAGGMSDSAGSAAGWSMCGLIRIGDQRGHAMDGMMGSRRDGADDAVQAGGRASLFFIDILRKIC